MFGPVSNLLAGVSGIQPSTIPGNGPALLVLSGRRNSDAYPEDL